MAVKKASDLKSTISSELADNNAGQISAYDVRHNLEDMVDSIVPIAASGDYQTYPFDNNAVNFNYLVVAKSGVKFDNAFNTADPNHQKIQTEPYLGVTGIRHNQLGGVDAGDFHSQYVSRSGCRTMTGNLGTGAEFINSSGSAIALSAATLYDNNGLSFSHSKRVGTGPDTGKHRETVHVGSGSFFGEGNSSTLLQFDLDKSKMDSAKSTALAWVHFDGTKSALAVQSSYNISAIEASGDGTYKVFLKPGLIADGDDSYCVIAHANGTTGKLGIRDMDLVNAASTLRNSDYFSITVQNNAGQYVNAKVIDAVVYGRASGTMPASGLVTLTNI